MKKKTGIVVIIVVVLTMAISGIIYKVYDNRKADENVDIAWEYQRDHELLDLDSSYNRTEYAGVEAIDEAALLVALYVYADDCEKRGEDSSNLLTYEDVVDYLSNEKNESGELMVFDRPEKLVAFYEWRTSPSSNNGEHLIDDFYNECNTAMAFYEKENEGVTQISGKHLTEFSFEQLMELHRMNAVQDYSYSDILEE